MITICTCYLPNGITYGIIISSIWWQPRDLNFMFGTTTAKRFSLSEVTRTVAIPDFTISGAICSPSEYGTGWGIHLDIRTPDNALANTVYCHKQQYEGYYVKPNFHVVVGYYQQVTIKKSFKKGTNKTN